MSALEAFRDLWSRIYDPRSGCPDVKVGYVLETMAVVLVKDMAAPANLTERWILAWLQLLGRPACLLDIQLAWERMHSDARKQGSKSTTAEDDMLEAARAIRSLAAAGLIRECKGEWAVV